MPRIDRSIQLLKGLMSGKFAYTGPFYVDVDITRRCNLRCPGCQYHSSKLRNPSSIDRSLSDIPISLVRRLSGELKTLGTQEVVLIGEGEPLLHPQLFEIISLFKGAGFKVQLFTNGTLIDEHIAQMLIDSGLDILKVSLWASSEEEYKKCYSTERVEHFRKTIEGVRTLANRKLKKKINHPTLILTQPLNRHNFTSIENRIALAESLGCDGLRFSVFVDWQGEFASAALSPDEIDLLCKDLLHSARNRLDAMHMIHNIDELMCRYRLGEAVWRQLPCYVGWFYSRVRVDGSVVSCDLCTLCLGDMHKNTFQEIWNRKRYQEFRAKASRISGLASLNRSCSCNWCCYVKDNQRIHRLFKYVAPLFQGR